MYPRQASAPSLKRHHDVKTAPAPIGGLNTRDSLANMPLTDAPVLVNWIPDIGGMRSRGGYFEWAINFPSAATVRSVVPFFSATDTFPGGTFVDTPSTLPGKVFAATDVAIYDVSAVTNAPAVAKTLSGTSMAGWLSSATLTNAAGSFLLVCSEIDGYMYYNGTAWTVPVAGTSPGQIDGVTPANLVHVNIWKKRAWFVERNSTRAWYLPVEAITGAAAQFDFGSLFRHGGHLEYLANWTMDAGEGIDDFLVAVGSNGDVVIFKGTDPSSVDTFGLVGQWYVGQIPIGRRSYCQLGGDLVILSTTGVFPISQITRGGTELLVATGDYAGKVRPSIGERVRGSFTSRGWQMAVHATERLLVVNTPNTETITNQQFAMSTTLNAWCEFADVPVYCLGVTAGYMLAGTTDGRVLLVYNGNYDNIPYGLIKGVAINTVIQYAFNYFDTPALEKQFLMARPAFLTQIEPGLVLDLDVNFTYSQPQYAVPNPLDPPSTEWDGDPLDPYDLWGTGYWDGIPGGRGVYWAEWRSVEGLGYAGAATMSCALTTRTTHTAMDYIIQSGGPL